GTSLRLTPLQEQIVGNRRVMLLVIMGAAFCMLCLAMVNLANLMIAQATTRQREIAIRASIGAGTSRLARQLIAESLALALLAGSGTSREGRTLRSTFMVAEIALAVMLLVGFVVMLQSVQRLLKVDPGFSADRVVSMHLSLPGSTYPKAENVAAFYEKLRERA